MSKRIVLLLIAVTVLLYAYSFWVHAPRGASGGHNACAPVCTALEDCDVRTASQSHYRVQQHVAPGGQEPFLRNPAKTFVYSKPFIYEEFINPSSSIQVHVPSMTELQDGTLAAVWYGGKYEGSKDTFIFFSTRAPGGKNSWAAPRGIVGRSSATKELKRYIKKVGNPLVFTDTEDRLWLLFVTVSVGGWSGSSLNVKISEDRGETWSCAQRLTLSPFLNISELARNNPVLLKDGGFAIPIYHEFIGTFSEMLWIRPMKLKGDRQKKLIKSFCGGPGGGFFKKSPLAALHYHKSRMTWGRRFIQPSVVMQGTQKAIAFYRGHFNNRNVTKAVSEDAGVTWSEPVPVGLPNPGSGLNALRLSDNHILLAYNNSKDNRENLSLAVLDQNGSNLLQSFILEKTPGKEFSYPYMICTRDGLIHLLYTWQRKRIKHVIFLPRDYSSQSLRGE